MTRLRDSLLFLSCWAMWSVVLLAVFNDTEWAALGSVIADWFGTHLTFFHDLMASFPFPNGYASMVVILVCVLLIWSNLAALLSMRSHDADIRKSALSLEELACHFGLDSGLIGAMQQERQVIVFHWPDGAVIAIRRAPLKRAPGIDAPPLHLVE